MTAKRAEKRKEMATDHHLGNNSSSAPDATPAGTEEIATRGPRIAQFPYPFLALALSLSVFSLFTQEQLSPRMDGIYVEIDGLFNCDFALKAEFKREATRAKASSGMKADAQQQRARNGG